MNIYAFDLSLRSTGIAMFNDGKMTLVTSKTDRKKTDLQDAVGVQAMRVFGPFQAGRPDVVVMESGALGAIRGQGYEELGALRWLVKDFVRSQYGFDVIQITPSHLKKSVTGNGRASKDDVELEVAKICAERDWPVPKNNDEADAVALILTYFADSKAEHEAYKASLLLPKETDGSQDQGASA